MKLTAIRWIVACTIVSFLCAGLLFQYIETEQNTYSNAAFVKATNHIKNRSVL